MFGNYLKTALRNLKRHKLFAFINITGLALGMAAVILIGLYIQDEMGFDRFHTRSEQIYRVAVGFGGSPQPNYVGSPSPLGPALKEKFPEVEEYVRFDRFSFKEKALMKYGGKYFHESRFFLADPSLFRVFDFKLIEGDPDAVLADPRNIVISQSMVKKYFGDEDPIGKILNYENQFDLVVSGVIQDIPSNSHLKFDFVGSFEYLNEIYGRDLLSSWKHWNFHTYLLLKKNVAAPEFEQKMEGFAAKIAKMPARNFLQNITDIHFHSKFGGEMEAGGDIRNIYLYSFIALGILLIACINFMNLYTANSEVRAREVAMRKVLGAEKKGLVGQFLSEALLFSFIALPFSLLLASAAIPTFNQITGKALALNIFQNQILFARLFLLTLLVGLLSGSYPAFFISAFQPVRLFHKKTKTSLKGVSFRNILVVFQFTVSIMLVAGTLIISDQLDFVRNTNLGYNRENIVNIPIESEEAKKNYETFKTEIGNHTQTLGVTATSFNPSIERWQESLDFEGRTKGDAQKFYRMSADYSLPELFELEFVAGRAFDPSRPSDLDNAFILNEKAVQEIGWDVNEAVGKRFGSTNGLVIGVVKNFNFQSLRSEIQPLAINVLPRMFSYAAVKIRPGKIQDTMRFLESTWNRINPGLPFEYSFYDDEFDRLYRSDLKLKSLFGYFTALAIFLACLGLFGLSLFVVKRRIKEISIRKVLGADFRHISLLLSKDFIKLILIANVFAVPLAIISVNRWLQDFVYRVNIGAFPFIQAALAALVVALLTISYQIIIVILADPIKAIRYE